MTAPSSTAETFAPVTVRMRKIENGINGSRTRDSITRNTTSSTTVSASRPSVQAEAQPWLGAFETA